MVHVNPNASSSSSGWLGYFPTLPPKRSVLAAMHLVNQIALPVFMFALVVQAESCTNSYKNPCTDACEKERFAGEDGLSTEFLTSVCGAICNMPGVQELVGQGYPVAHAMAIVKKSIGWE